VWLEVFSQFANPLTSSEIKPTTFMTVKYCPEKDVIQDDNIQHGKVNFR
jgi:hypothetical protein